MLLLLFAPKSVGGYSGYDKKKRYIIGKDVLFLNSNELANILIQKSQQVPEKTVEVKKVLQNKSNESILQTYRISAYFPLPICIKHIISAGCAIRITVELDNAELSFG